MKIPIKTLIAATAAMLGGALMPAAGVQAASTNVNHVLLISVDGMHALDFINCSRGLSGVNGGLPYCPNLNALANNGYNYINTSTSKPSDSFPGLMALVTGGSPKTTGIYYDVAYDRVLAPPQNTTGNGLLGGTCTPNQNNGTSTEYEEGIDIDQSQLNGGAPSGEGGVNSIDSTRLVRDPFNNCNPVWPYNFVRVNTIFGVISAAGGYTAWEDKHPAYIAVAGPGTGATVNDFYAPEINSNSANFIPLPNMTVMNCSPLPDQAAVAAGDDYTGSFQNIQCYDSLKVQGIINEIDGKTHDGSAAAPVPTIFGMNFQAVSVGQKLIYQDSTSVPPGYSITGGYLDSLGTPSPSLYQEITYVDTMIGKMVAELKKQGLLDSTLIVITAKHGQSPIDPLKYFPIPGHSPLNNGTPPSALLGSSYLPDSELNQIGPTEDDVSLLWLAPGASVTSAVGILDTPANLTAAGIGEILWGNAISPVYGTPGVPPSDPRTPDIIVTPNFGVVYTGSKKKLAEHGGFSHDDTNVIMLVSNPGYSRKSYTASVTTSQVAPTILKALGLNPNALKAVRLEGTQTLPGF
ncbi:MAG TPA: alkaline phosphatase family protein [Candidatus Binataceae bacterium]|nr:alkaline phosphatase family protein [Candidatus Binataceae bacterium]